MNSNEFGKDEQTRATTDMNHSEKQVPGSLESAIASEQGIHTEVPPQTDSYTKADANGTEDSQAVGHKAAIEQNHHYEPSRETRVVSAYEGLYAGFWMRFWAYLLDLIVIGSVNRMILNPVFRALDVPLAESEMFAPISIATAIVFYLYFVLMTKFYGQTLGKMVFGLKVVDLDGKNLSWGTVIFREWIGRFISATVMILYIVVAFTNKKQGLHDLFADTSVIYEPR